MALTQEQIEQIRWATTLLNERRPTYTLHRNYYAGNHRLMITEERLAKVFAGLFKDFRLNLCPAVVDALGDRLQVQSFSSGEGAQAQPANEALEVWKRNRMRRRSGYVHLEAITAGDSYAIVWPDRSGARAVIYPQRATDIAVEYDPENPGTITRAAKLWLERDKSHRLTLYYPDRIEKYTTPEKTYANAQEAANTLASGVLSFEPRRVEGEAWPLTNPYGRVPIFHFANNADLGNYGASELDDAVSVQDALNKAVLDMLVNGEFLAYPQRFALNIEVKDDADGNPINPFKAGPERIWVLNGGEDTQMGQFAAADIEKMDKVVQSWSLRMAQVTQTPPHYFMLSSNFVSGESQKTAEQKLDAKTFDRQIAFGDTWSDLMAFAVQIEHGLKVDGLEFDTNWKDTKPRNQLEEWQIAEMKAERGVSDEQILEEQGYTTEQIEKFREANGGRLSVSQVLTPSVPALNLELPEGSANGAR